MVFSSAWVQYKIKNNIKRNYKLKVYKVIARIAQKQETLNEHLIFMRKASFDVLSRTFC